MSGSCICFAQNFKFLKGAVTDARKWNPTHHQHQLTHSKLVTCTEIQKLPKDDSIIAKWKCSQSLLVVSRRVWVDDLKFEATLLDLSFLRIEKQMLAKKLPRFTYFPILVSRGWSGHYSRRRANHKGRGYLNEASICFSKLGSKIRNWYDEALVARYIVLSFIFSSSWTDSLSMAKKSVCPAIACLQIPKIFG